MNDKFLIIRIDPETKDALRKRAFALCVNGGMSELVKMLIHKELTAADPTPTPAPTQAQ